MCYSGNWTLVVRYQQGILGLGVGETEYEANGHISAIAIDYDRTEDHYCMTPITFGEVLAFMGWEIDEDRCGDLNTGQLPLEQARAAVPATQI